MSKTFYSKKTVTLIREFLNAAGIEAFDSQGKNVTGKTVQSVETDMDLDGWKIDSTTKAGAGAKYIIEGKPAGTKLPVEKVGGEWQLKPNLQEWKEAVGNEANYWVLAKSIADKERKGVDIPQIAFDIYLKKYATPIERMVASDFTQAQREILFPKLEKLYQ